MKTLQEIYNKYSMNDCGGDKGTMHSYIEIYEEIFKNSRKNISLLEIGIYEGHSLMMWSEYFEDSKIFGIDINIDIIKFEIPNNVNVICGDANNKTTLRYLQDYKFDYIIDDGSHKINDQLVSYVEYSSLLKNGGTYIIEDIANIDGDRDKFLNLSSNAEIIDLRHKKNRYDDVMVVIKK